MVGPGDRINLRKSSYSIAQFLTTDIGALVSNNGCRKYLDYNRMWVRTAVRSSRPWGGSPAVRIVTASPLSRTYAKSSKPRKPLEYSSRHGPNASRYQPPAGDTSNRLSKGSAAETSSQTGTPDFSKVQDEFAVSDSSNANTAPQSSSPSAIDPAKLQDQNQSQQPQRPLPDLTQGIPSTFEAELAQAEQASRTGPRGLNVTEDPAAEPETSTGGRRGSDLPKSANITSFERRRNRFANYMYLTLFSVITVGTIYSGRNWENEEEERKHPDAPSGWGFGLFYKRASARLADVMDYYNEPAFPKLLPNTDPTWERPYTLVLSLEDLLIHSEWTREHGWRMAKRPGVDYFLRYLSQYYELVIFTSVPSMAGDPIIRKLDPYRIIMWPLFREATRYRNGEYIKVKASRYVASYPHT